MNTSVVKKQSIASLIDIHKAVKNKVVQIRKLMDEIEVIANSQLRRGLLYDLKYNDFKWNCCQEKVDFVFWETISKELTNVMRNRNTEQFLEMIRRETPEFCETQIDAFVQNINRLYKDNYEQTVREVYTTFIQCNYGNWKNKKVDNLREIRESFRCHKSKIDFEDLYLCCKLLDGRSKGDYSDSYDAILNNPEYKDIVQTDYFSVQYFVNGNQLVKWNPDKEHIRILLNQIGSGEKKLPDVMKKRYKKEHFDVDES